MQPYWQHWTKVQLAANLNVEVNTVPIHSSPILTSYLTSPRQLHVHGLTVPIHSSSYYEYLQYSSIARHPYLCLSTCITSSMRIRLMWYPQHWPPNNLRDNLSLMLPQCPGSHTDRAYISNIELTLVHVNHLPPRPNNASNALHSHKIL
jgi:hypothetical protein